MFIALFFLQGCLVRDFILDACLSISPPVDGDNTLESKQARNIQYSQQNGQANTFLQRLSTSRKPQYKEKKVHQGGTYNFKSNTTKSATDLQSSFSFSSRYSWEARPTFTRVWPLCQSVSLFSSSVPPTLDFCLFLVGWSMMNATIPSLFVFISSRFRVCGSVGLYSNLLLRKTRDSRESWRLVGRRNLHFPFLRPDVLGGVETATHWPISVIEPSQ